jgi:hypothetical protein
MMTPDISNFHRRESVDAPKGPESSNQLDVSVRKENRLKANYADENYGTA